MVSNLGEVFLIQDKVALAKARMRPVLLVGKRRYLVYIWRAIFGRYFCPSSEYRPNIALPARR
jgi:hypothetical protein